MLLLFGCGQKNSNDTGVKEKVKKYGQHFDELILAVERGDGKGLIGLNELWETEKQGVEYKEVSRDRLAYYFFKKPVFLIKTFSSYDPDKLDWMYRSPEDSPENIEDKEYYGKILKELKKFHGTKKEMVFTKKVIINLIKQKYLYGL